MDVGQSPIFTADVSYSSFPLLVTTELNYITCFMNTKKIYIFSGLWTTATDTKNDNQGVRRGNFGGSGHYVLL